MQTHADPNTPGVQQNDCAHSTNQEGITNLKGNVAYSRPRENVEKVDSTECRGRQNGSNKYTFFILSSVLQNEWEKNASEGEFFEQPDH